MDSPPEVRRKVGRLVLLNAFPLNAFPYFQDLEVGEDITLAFRRLSLEDLKDMTKRHEIVNYIRHPGTLQFLSNKLGIELKPSNDIYREDKRDIVVIITLKNPERGKETSNITDDDLLIYMLSFLYPGWWVSDKG